MARPPRPSHPSRDSAVPDLGPAGPGADGTTERTIEAAVARTLLDRRTTAAELARVAADPRWARSRTIVPRLFFHPHAPGALRARLLDALAPMELVRAGASGLIPPPLRQRAAVLVQARIGELAAGARVVLARGAGRPLLTLLLDSTDEAVLEGLLDNGGLREIEAVRIAARPATPPRALAALAGHRTWGQRLEVCRALAQNPGTPCTAVPGLVSRLPLRDLHGVADDGKVAEAVRIAARQRIERAPPVDEEGRDWTRVD